MNGILHVICAENLKEISPNLGEMKFDQNEYD